ncbi:helix-turn-helix domain-containing protein [Saccharomonospora sp. CUA-673]|uniref:winged helix-turn-helix transcriptional regulator n=1 Tax=Saccharomonospora sp. CUA-673 TaxID=1904969 RepID=UPI0009FB3A43|nr:helix-turn-helix domain-containing protein [Saccharomonospora sp. CUA-673]
MATRRSYPDSCGMAQALNVIGERWALLIVRELLFGPKRFADLNDELPGISKAVLSQRLDELEARAVLRRRRLPRRCRCGSTNSPSGAPSWNPLCRPWADGARVRRSSPPTSR